MSFFIYKGNKNWAFAYILVGGLIMNNNIFDRVEKKTKVKKEDILSLARSLQNKNLKDEGELRKIIKDVAKMAGKEVSKEREEKIIDAIIKDKIPKNLDKHI